MLLSLQAIFFVTKRECKRIWNNSDLRLVCLVSPLIYCFLLSSIYWHERVTQIPIGVVDQDHTKLSRLVTRSLDATQNLQVVGNYLSVDEAMSDMKDGNIDAFLVVPFAFSHDVKRGVGGRLQAAINSSNILVANPAMTAMAETAGTLSSGAFVKYLRKNSLVEERATVLAQNPTPVINTLFNPRYNYSDFFLPGVIFVVLQQILIVGVAFSMALERSDRSSWQELLMVSQRRASVLFVGKSLPYIIGNFVFGIWFLLAVCGAFRIPINNWPELLIFMILFMWTVGAFAFVLSTFFTKVANALMALMFYSMPAFLISGFAWPVYALPWYLKIVAMLFPMTFFLTDMRMLLLGSMGIKNAMVLLCPLFCYAVVITLLAWMVTRFLIFRSSEDK